jgi:hypothetical protein
LCGSLWVCSPIVAAPLASDPYDRVTTVDWLSYNNWFGIGDFPQLNCGAMDDDAIQHAAAKRNGDKGLWQRLLRQKGWKG